ncbi:fibroblast growth factor 1-like [Megalops cyprinoides]|uniref:fibroblast growth factor 1-like n=1 Tax=Megalops cyprinoides TaxID=118141 RepID=UPI001864FFA0|nr:fibroblast growth factor 1-like [Megalops cyprinoides]
MLANFGHPAVAYPQPLRRAAEAFGTSCRMTEGTIICGPENTGFQLPDYRQLTRLYCLNGGYHLRIRPDGTVDGNREENDLYCVFRVRAVSIGVVIIAGVEAGRYLAMDKDGKLYGSKTLSEECCFCENMEENHYNTYRSQRHGDGAWYVGIKKNGQPKPGPSTHIGQKAVYFLPRPADRASE